MTRLADERGVCVRAALKGVCVSLSLGLGNVI